MSHNAIVWSAIGLVLLALGITIYLFRRRQFDKGYKKGEAANPSKVRRENPPDSTQLSPKDSSSAGLGVR